jgi:sRNA-binding protein
MSSDIFIEYRVDEKVSGLVGRKVLERRFAVARFTKEDKKENKSDDDTKKKQEKKPTTPSTSSETQKPKEQTNKPKKPESKPKKDEDTPVPIKPIKPVQPTSQGIPMLWVIIGLGIVGALIFWLKIKNRR